LGSPHSDSTVGRRQQIMVMVMVMAGASEDLLVNG